MMLRRKLYQLLQFQDYALGVWSCRAMQWRGYSSRPVHPKHLFDEQRSSFLHGLLAEDITFLDLGSGVGSDCLAAWERGARLSVGVEGSMESIYTAVQRCRQKNLPAYFLRTDLEQKGLPFVDHVFDLVNFSNVLEHLHNRTEMLQELKRVKKENGLAVISIPNADTSWKKRLRAAGLDSRDDPDHKVEYTKASLLEELHRAGLVLDSDLFPIIPGFPVNGLIALSAVVSPGLYRWLQAKKRAWVEANPEESVGWVFTVK